MAGIKVIFGGGSLRPDRGFPDPETVKEALDVLEANGVDTIDTARIYGTSETLLGQAGAGARFVIDTKIAGGFAEGSLSRKKLRESVETSLRELKVERVHTLYFHAPDKSTPLEEALEEINELHKAGIFSQFGLSNYLAEDVEEVHQYCKSHNYVLPTVYQGKYNPIARRVEESLFPTLRKLGICFYAYSPVAGGFLAKTKQEVLEGRGRFKEGSLYRRLYAHPPLLDILSTWGDIAAEARCAPSELAVRWVTYNSRLKADYADGIIVGAMGVSQAEETLGWVAKGPLDASISAKIEDLWEQVKDDAPLDTFNG